MSPESLTSYFAENPTPEHEIADLRAKLQTAEQQLSQSKELHEFFFNRSKDLESYLQAAKRDIEISKESIQASEQRLKQVTAALVKIPCKECCGVKKVRVDGFKLGPCPFCADRDKALSATPSDGCGKGRMDRLTIYVASKTKHAPMWLKFRDKGFPIVSTWIDEAGHGESSDLCDLAMRCIREAAEASFTVLYCEPGETLKGALMEAGSALASCREVRCVGTCDNLSPVLSLHPKWKAYQSVEEALAASIIGKEGGV